VCMCVCACLTVSSLIGIVVSTGEPLSRAEGPVARRLPPYRVPADIRDALSGNGRTCVERLCVCVFVCVCVCVVCVLCFV